MTRYGEIIAFTGLAIGVHVGLFVQFGPSGVQSQGSTGQASISLMAASSNLAEKVAAWTQPVEVMQALSAKPLAAPQYTTSIPAITPAQVRDTPAAMPTVPKFAPVVPEALPRVDTETAAPPQPRRAPQSSPRPQPRIARDLQPPAPLKPPQSQTAPAPPQQSKGGATGRNAGATQDLQSASLSKAARQSLMAKWGASIRNSVERRKRYPLDTTQSGTTVLRITISRDGQLKSVSVTKSSGTHSLDQAAIKAVQRAKYPAAPKGLSADQFQFNLPVAFKRS
ncbi:MAG: TonB family protein [Roseobacter sp.]